MNVNYLKFEMLAAMKMLIVMFQVVTPCWFVGGYSGFGRTYRLSSELISSN
jgi:hypothetical protein